MNKHKSIMIGNILVIVILIAVCICLGINNYMFENQLKEAQIMLELSNEELASEIEKYDVLVTERNELDGRLEIANTIIESLKSDEYITGVIVTDKEIDMLAKTVWGEARGCNRLEQSAVVWCILNRVDAGRGTIAEVITAPGQFHGYSKNFPVTDSIRELCEDVVARWKLEKLGVGNVGRTLPNDYLYFWADSTGIGNVFRNKFSGNYTKWNWDCWNPYE